MKENNFSVSIVIPTFNEEEDIKKTLDACVSLTYPLKEIIVVDDSMDQTPLIVRQYEFRGTRLIKRERNIGGRCGARNEGILAAKGDVLVILNADVILPRDFIEKIAKHYRKGADYVLVESEVINQDNPFARFIEALHRYNHRRGTYYLQNEWTEGFSCRRETALAVGLFPVTPINLTAGEDGYFGEKIKARGYKKIFDRSIIVKHFAPNSFKEFWKTNKERISAVASYFLNKQSISLIILRSILRLAVVILEFGLIFPILFRAFRISWYSPRGPQDFLLFAYILTVQEMAFLVGKWSSLSRVVRYLLKNFFLIKQNHFRVLNDDLRGVESSFKKSIIRAKLLYYFFQRPIAHFILKNHLKKILKEDLVLNQVDKFLLNEGGMFKEYVYGICNKFLPLRNSTILVPGIGYGRNLFQLAAFRPKVIIAFDIYAYPQEWQFLTERITKIFGTKVYFFKGGFESVPEEYLNSCDFVISDAVLEHVKNLNEFVKNSSLFLKPNGIFYASFGPIWYGPGGDHIDWDKDKLFNHLLLSKEEYQRQFKEELELKEIGGDFYESTFVVVKERIFSYLKTEEYLEILKKQGFKKYKLYVKISTESLSLVKNKPEIQDELNKKEIPQFDRYCSGLYLWMKLYK